MARTEVGKRMMMTGTRKSGEADFEFTIYGNAASQFPPLIMKMSLIEMQEWLREMRATPPASGNTKRRRMRLLG